MYRVYTTYSQYTLGGVFDKTHIVLIPKLASYLSMIEKIYGRSEMAFIYGCYALAMNNFIAYNMFCLLGECYLIGQFGGISLVPFVRYSIRVCSICFHGYFDTHLLSLIIFP